MDYKDVVNALNKLSGDLAQACELFGDRGLQGWKLMKERAVKKYIFQPSGRTQWIVVGKKGDYILYPVVGYCQCNDFFFQVMQEKAYVCQHLISQRLSNILGMYDLIEVSDELFETLMKEWRAEK